MRECSHILAEIVIHSTCSRTGIIIRVSDTWASALSGKRALTVGEGWAVASVGVCPRRVQIGLVVLDW